MELIEKAAYLQGLLAGLEVDEATKEGKVFHAMCDLLADMAGQLKAMEQDLTQAEEQLEDLRGDVEELQADFYEDDADAPCYEVDCPNCGEVVYVTEEDLDAGEAFCTSCGCTFEVALDDSEEGADGDDDAAQDLRRGDGAGRGHPAVRQGALRRLRQSAGDRPARRDVKPPQKRKKIPRAAQNRCGGIFMPGGRPQRVAAMAFSSQIEPMSRALYRPWRTDWRAVRSFMGLDRSVDSRVTWTLSGISRPSTGAVESTWRYRT